MSKGNMLLGHARGKVGDLVFSRTNGQQVVRARAAVVKNPQTEAQMIQRIILNTIAQAYSRMSTICDHSFEGVATGQKSMSQFMRRNMAAMRDRIAYENSVEDRPFGDIYAFSPVGTNIYTINPYVISTGSLPAVDIVDIEGGTGATIAVTAAGETLTYADVIESLGLQRGDQLTFISSRAYIDHRADFGFQRVILDPTAANGTQLDLNTPFLDGTEINAPSPRNNGDTLQFSFANSQLKFRRAEATQFAAAVIVSRQKTDGSWLRSNATMAVYDGVNLLLGDYSLQEALDMIASGAIELTSERYLNNAVRRANAQGALIGAFTANLGLIPAGGTKDQVTDTPVEVIGIRTVGSGSSAEVVAYDAENNEYSLLDMDSFHVNYLNKLISTTGTATTAWDSAFSGSGSEATLSGSNPALLVFNASDGQNVYNDFAAWLVSQGVDVRVFTILEG